MKTPEQIAARKQRTVDHLFAIETLVKHAKASLGREEWRQARQILAQIATHATEGLVESTK
jgi:hypothetical protein